MSEKDREMQAMKQKYELEIQAIREETNQRFIQIISMIQHNPKLAHIKPEALIKKMWSSSWVHIVYKSVQSGIFTNFLLLEDEDFAPRMIFLTSNSLKFPFLNRRYFLFFHILF